jgi:D-tyrosyl-tRNA(Tyr) deacylase
VRAVVQRVSRARVVVGGETTAAIAQGLCVLLGVARDDAAAEAERLAGKVARLRIFENEAGKFDQSLLEVAGEALVVSQFTLIADTKRRKGTRPTSPERRREPGPNLFTTASARHFEKQASRSRLASSARGWNSSSSTTGPSRSSWRRRPDQPTVTLRVVKGRRPPRGQEHRPQPEGAPLIFGFVIASARTYHLVRIAL